MKTSLRDKNIVLLRPKVNSNKNISYKNDIEKFQNIVIRPILKFQNDLLLELFIFELEKTKTKFDLINNEQKIKLIINNLKYNHKIKQILLGTIIGIFSNKDITFYKTNYSKINKRIFSMLNDRLIDQLIELDVV
tara:strand:+ start:467 stop:871 length:405 start_codon:yes stop_codon:yes gene_type:complete